MKFRFHRKMNEFNPDAGNEGASTQGQADGATTETKNSESGTQVDEGQASSDNTDNDSEFNFETLPKSAQDYIKSLRTESADHRTKNNNLSTRLESIEKGFKTMFGEEGGEQDSTPEQQLEKLQGGYEDLSYNNAVMGMAYENGIPQENYEYFNFLMDKEVNGLEEGQELEEESLMSIIQKAKGFNQSQDQTNSSVDSKGQNDPNQSGEVNLEQFTQMSVVQKSELYRKKPAVYNSLMLQAKQKRLL